MNAKVFKNLIKEAVREAVREEIGVLLLEQKKSEIMSKQPVQENLSFNTNDVDTVGMRANLRNKLASGLGLSTPQVQDTTTNNKNPFASFLEESAASMTPQELSGLRNLG